MSDRPRVIKRMRDHDALCWPFIADGLEKAMPLSGIVKHLVSHNVPPPQGKYWHEKAVHRIIDRRNRREQQRACLQQVRKNMLAGAWVAAQVEEGVLEADAVLADLDEFLTRDEDRALFGLAPKR